jgi:hypothetical protein
MLSGIHELELTQRLVEGEVTKITECTIVCNRRTLRPQGLRLPCRGGYSPIRFFREGGAVLAAPNALAWPPGRPNEVLRRGQLCWKVLPMSIMRGRMAWRTPDD